MTRKTENSSKGWWHFTGEGEVFQATAPDRVSRLYFPLCNEAGLLSSITPTLQGDIKTGQNSFLTLPESAEDLHNTRAGRNFWVRVEGKTAWSAVGSSGSAQEARYRSRDSEKCTLEAGALWHKVTRENRTLGLRAEILNFAPASTDQVEIMQITLTNLKRKPLRLTPTAAIPIFARSADNLRDHRHVTSLLHRIFLHDNGVLITPTMSFDERGHKLNTLTYAVLGVEGEGDKPLGAFPTVLSFIGEGGSFDAPQAVFEDLDVPELSETELQGREAVGALRFKTRKLPPGKSLTYILFLGVASEKKQIEGWLKTFGTEEKVTKALEANRAFWKNRLDTIQIRTDNKDFNGWFRWVALQPMLRKIFGCSFLPDFDYGRGGRGWRDLWQDCLALLLIQPAEARQLLLNNFGGIRINGTNATIIGKKPGEFIADRNNISRTWMDHGVWPFITTELYIHQSGDLDILLQETDYFWDQDTPPKGEERGGKDSQGSVLEHLLAQHLTAYFNVGEHGNCRLEDADWNDGMDMGHDRGESVAFTAVYAGNLVRLAGLLRQLEKHGIKNLTLAEELGLLLESKARSVDLAPAAKKERLAVYRQKTKTGISGQKITLTIEDLAADLEKKGESLSHLIRDQEWITAKSGHRWFNGYYDNLSQRVEGDHPQGVRMTLTGQVFPIMSGVAAEEQVGHVFLATKKYLQDHKFGGFRLNTDFGDSQPSLGRAFSFAYGEKENGAFFSHMVIMFANALYQRDFVEEGYEVLNSLYKMCLDTQNAKIYPGVPEYFNGEGRGFYHYLTGSGSWLVLTLITQVLGIRGKMGDLLLAPKLMAEQFGQSGQIMAEVGFAGKRLRVTYFNRGKKPYGKYRIESVLLHGRSLPKAIQGPSEVLISRNELTSIPDSLIEITVALA